MHKDFDRWNEIKKDINGKKQIQDVFFHSREIWWCSLGLNVGSEEDGKNELFERPVLIIKVFNLDTVRVIPLSSKLKDDINHVHIFFNNKWSVAKLSQLKTISTNRLSRKLTVLDEVQFEKVVEALRTTLL